MEVGNVSAQLFVKQLPINQNAAYTGCKQDFNTEYLTTCVNNEQSDIAIEGAFQQQLSLSETYKSPYIFDAIKNQYISKTMEGQNDTGKVEMYPQPTPEVSSQPPMDFLKVKESFGSNPTLSVPFLFTALGMIIISIVCLIFAYFDIASIKYIDHLKLAGGFTGLIGLFFLILFGAYSV